MKQYPGSRKATLEQQGLSMESTIQICVSRPEEAVYTLDVCRFWRKLWSFFTENGQNEPNGIFNFATRTLSAAFVLFTGVAFGIFLFAVVFSDN